MIREKLRTQLSQKESIGGDKSVYPFWNLNDGESSEIRFLPDGNPDNTFFWIEKSVIRLPFNGTINGQNNTDKEVYVQVPCMEMYGKTCPILQETKPWWNDSELKELARVYWRKKTYLFHGFIVKDGLNEENQPENPIRKFMINVSIFEIIKNTLMDPDIEDLVVDFEKGRDFRIQKTKKGQQYSDYSTSRFVIKTRPLSSREREAINEYGLPDLRTYLPPQPDNKTLNVIMDMFHASVNGEAYDFNKWGDFYKPMNFQAPDLIQNESTKNKLIQIKSLSKKDTTEFENVSSKRKNIVENESQEDEEFEHDKEVVSVSPVVVKSKVEDENDTNSVEEEKTRRILEMIKRAKNRQS